MTHLPGRVGLETFGALPRGLWNTQKLYPVAFRRQALALLDKGHTVADPD